MSERGRLSCVIFDIDGTLTQTNELIFASFNHVAKKHLGRIFAPSEIVAMFGPPEEGALSAMFGEASVDVVMDELCDFYREHHAAMATVHAGMEDILRFLKDRGVRLAVFTGKGKRTAEITLDGLKLKHYFDLVVSGNDVVHHKPHPEGIQKVLSAFSLQPAEVLMVGDSLGDMKASRAAGVRIATVLWDSHDRERVLQAGTDFVFYETGQLLDWFRTHFNSERYPPT
jgi:pyrophosphatase PpaX